VILAGLLTVVLFSAGWGGTRPSNPPGGATLNAPSPAGITTATANLLALSPDSSPKRTAPDFHLTDQSGRPISLSQFRGEAVVLSFNDDECTDVCTLLAQDIVRADQYLGATGRSRVTFVSVNVNPFYPQVRYVKQWTGNHDLGKLANWYFATGPVPALQAIWKAYGIYVGADPKTRSVTHGAVIEFVGPSGHLEAGADFGQNAVDVDPYSHGLAQMAVDTLPRSLQTPVTGPQATASGGSGARLSEQAPDFRLPLLGTKTTILDLANLRGRPVVVNFWASTCVDCRAELAAFAQAAEQDPKISFVGVDVADPSAGTAVSLTRQAGITYPQVADTSGQVASTYQVTDLPTTVFLDGTGKVVVRHPGTLTAENLVYALGQFFPNDLSPGGS
jgi:cytochrome oxidase Cu insertion factor (SCO1/SenC/PrrC family)